MKLISLSSKKVAYAASILIIGLSFLSIPSNDRDLMTGSFTEAQKTPEPTVKEVRWRFDDKVVEGPIARHNFSEGFHNVTVQVEKSDGEIETYRAQVEIRK